MGDKHQTTPPPPKPRRTIIGVIRDVFLERYPEAKPVREYLGEKMPGVKLKRWVVFLLWTIGLAALGSYFVHRADKSSFDSKVSSTNFFYAGELAKKENDISNLKGQLSDAKSDRDKYQIMLAPFQAAALKIYTNEPLASRLDFLASELGDISKQANIGLVINRSNTIFVISDMPLFSPTTASNLVVISDRKIGIGIFNESKYPAINSFVDFLAPIDATNLIIVGWNAEPQCLDGRNHWRYNADHSIAKSYTWLASTIEISTNFTGGHLIGEFDIGADNAPGKSYLVDFALPQNK